MDSESVSAAVPPADKRTSQKVAGYLTTGEVKTLLIKCMLISLVDSTDKKTNVT